MGSTESRPEGGGFRIFKICDQSPAERAGLEVFFDFIVEAEGVGFLNISEVDNRDAFFSIVQKSIDRQINLSVFNARTRSLREVRIVPSRWGGAGLLGATVRYDMLENAFNQGIRVLQVNQKSPAADAGLVAYKDYLLCVKETALAELDELVEFVNNSLEEELQISVYNSETQRIREVTLVPNSAWGGKGCIGCDIGTGYLHRIPHVTPFSPVATGDAESANSTSPASEHSSSAGVEHHGSAEVSSSWATKSSTADLNPESQSALPETTDAGRRTQVTAPDLPNDGGMAGSAVKDAAELAKKIQEQLKTSKIISSHSPLHHSQQTHKSPNNTQSIEPRAPHPSASIMGPVDGPQTYPSSATAAETTPSGQLQYANGTPAGSFRPPPVFDFDFASSRDVLGHMPPAVALQAYYHGGVPDPMKPPRPGALRPTLASHAEPPNYRHGDFHHYPPAASTSG